jgi:focal adhesion kinase 1
VKSKRHYSKSFLDSVLQIILSSLNSFFSEILMEERRERDETMWRENRRVAAVSWGSTGSTGNGEDLPPPKPSRVPATYVGVGGSANVGKLAPPASSEQSLPGPTTYLVAPNSEVLAQLMRENETRADAGHTYNYTAPASAFNTFTVEFSHTNSSSSNPASPQHKSKTKGRKNQPVYANIMMSDSTLPPATTAAVATNPASYKDVRINACRVEQENTHPHLVGVCMVLR